MLFNLTMDFTLRIISGTKRVITERIKKENAVLDMLCRQ